MEIGRESVVYCYLNLTDDFGESESIMCSFGKSGETDKYNATCLLGTSVKQIMKV